MSPEYLEETDSSLGRQQMDSPCSVDNITDDAPRVKLLCSFLGSIMPRPQDGKLRYVGGETRIVSLPRDISYEELMSKMGELCNGVSVLKYQQPDEDLDALVSVVNNDDVINMMEEYDKLGSGDGLTRLRIFLFPNPDPDGSLHYIDGDESDTQKWYVDALNNLNDGSEFRRQQLDSPLFGQIDDGIHAQDSFFDGGIHGHRSSDMSMLQYNLCHVAIPQRYNEVEGPWSPAYYSPRHHGGHLDPRTVSEFPNSPPLGRYRMHIGEFSDTCIERMPEELARSQLGHHPAYEHPPAFAENLEWIPSGVIPGDRAGFPGNFFRTPGGFEGNSSCEHCRVALQRNQPHLEQPLIGNGLPQASKICSECSPNREPLILNADPKLHLGMYPKEQNDPQSSFNEAFDQDVGWVMQHQPIPRADDATLHISGAGRFNDQFSDSPAMNYPIAHVNYVDSHQMSSNLVRHRAGTELGSEVIHDQALPPIHHLHIGTPEDHSAHSGKYPFVYGTENLHPMTPGHLHAQTFWKNAQNRLQGTTNAHEASTMTPYVNGKVNAPFLRATPDVSQPVTGMDGLYPWAESSQQVVGFDGTNTLDHNRCLSLKLSASYQDPENRQITSSGRGDFPGPVDMLPLPVNLGSQSHLEHPSTVNSSEVAKTCRNISLVNSDRKFSDHGGSIIIQVPDVLSIPQHEDNKAGNCDVGSTIVQTIHSNGMNQSGEPTDNPEDREENFSPILGDPNLSLSRLSFVPELIASIKKAALEEAGEVKAVEGKSCDPLQQNLGPREAAVDSEVANTEEEQELDSDNDNMNTIEPTKAEAEAVERGLQAIRNDDLEEMRELGSGTYGAVYHGKWKGSDVAIKRIKASCFTGKPSERERLIADFWKEALILSSLHHPNVVSFYGIVRDGPDGSLATVTEFMVNGSLKQFLQKKDRTIDRRKRLIIAMDAAFGMEYLHGKNIVHFDLKCENLLVNMRDPQRPICKIGDLGLSKVKQHTLVSGGVRGTLPWMAPELLSGKNHMVSEKIDVYSFAIVMWELLTGEEPYAGMHCASIIGGIVNNTLRPQSPTWCDPEWKALMESCWSSDPADRPSFSEISRKLRKMAAAINVK